MPNMKDGLFDLNSFGAPAATAQQPEAKKKRGGVAGFLGDVAHAAISPFAYLGNAAIVNPTKQLAADVTGNKKAAANARKSTNENLGLGEQGTDFTGGLKKFVGNSAQALLTAVAPAAATLKKGATVGAATGASSALAQKDSTLEDVATGALAGGATGGALTGVGKVLSKGGKKTAEKSALMKNLTTQGQQMQARGLGISGGAKVSGKELAPQDSERMLQVLKDEGIKTGNANSAARDLNARLKNYGQQIAEHFKTKDAPLHPEDTKVIGTNFVEGLKTTDPSVLNQANILVNDLQKNVKSTKDLWEFRKSLDSRIPKTKFMDENTSNKVAALKSMREYISKELGDIPGMQKYHDLSEVKPFLGKGMRELNQPNGGVVGRVLSSGPVQKAESVVGKGVEKVGNLGAKEAAPVVEPVVAGGVPPVASGFAGRMARQGTTALAGASVVPEQQAGADQAETAAPQEGDVLAGSGTQDELGFGGGVSANTDPFAAENVQSSVQSILAKGGTMKDVTEYLGNVKMLEDLSGGAKSKPLTASQATRAAAAQNALKDIPLIEDAIKSGKLGGAKALLGSGTQIGRRLLGTENLDASLFNIADNILRARSGAAAPEAEVKRFVETFLPSATDSAKAKQQKLERAIRELQGYVDPNAATEDTLAGLVAQQ